MSKPSAAAIEDLDREERESSDASSEAAVLRSILPAARKIAEYGFRIPRQDVDDVLQQAAVDFLMHARRGAQASAGLMIVITRRRCLDFWRSQYRARQRDVTLDQVREEDPAYLVECDYSSDQATLDGVRLAQTWPSLSENCRAVLARRFWQNQRTADVADRLGYKPGTLKRMISRCLGRLRRCLEDPA